MSPGPASPRAAMFSAALALPVNTTSREDAAPIQRATVSRAASKSSVERAASGYTPRWIEAWRVR